LPSEDAYEFSELIAHIYDAAMDPGLWPIALDHAARFVGTDMGFLISEGTATGGTVVHAESRAHFSAGFVDGLFAEQAHPEAIVFPDAIEALAGRTFSDESCIRGRETVAPAFCHNWSGPHGFVDFDRAVMAKLAPAFRLLLMLRNKLDGRADSASVMRAKMLLPHLQRALGVGGRLALSKLETSALAETLNGLSTAVILVQHDLSVRFANAKAGLLFSSGDLLREVKGELVAKSAASTAALRNAVACCETGDTAAGAEKLSIQLRASSGKAFIAHVLPLGSGKRKQLANDFAAVAAIFVKPVQSEEMSPLQALGEMYHLTARELAVLLAIAETGGIPAVARLLGISPGTVKGHLKHVFAKTLTRRQADLAKIVAGVANPFHMPVAS
jgi:DNA-binding CsgD family transcriptional regulator